MKTITCSILLYAMFASGVRLADTLTIPAVTSLPV